MYMYVDMVGVCQTWIKQTTYLLTYLKHYCHSLVGQLWWALAYSGNLPWL